MKRIYVLLLLGFTFAHAQTNLENKERVKVHGVLDNWHKAAADADFEKYFEVMTPSFVFLGTDASEYWTRSAFAAYAKPYFDKGKAWKFTRIERHIYFNYDRTTAWFDELLDTQMKICRGSGVLLRQNGQWKIAQYVLSMTVPNENSDAVIKIKTPIEDVQLDKIKNLK
jgi:SnoaL-like domain